MLVFSLTKIFDFLGQIYPKKGYFRSETEKINTTIESVIFKLVKAPIFDLNWQCGFFGPNLHKKRLFPLENRESEYYL